MLNIGPSSLRGLKPGSGLVSRRALGHYKAGELALVGSIVLVVLALFLAAGGILLGMAAGLSPAASRAILASAFGVGLCMLYAGLIESRRLTVRRLELTCPKVGGTPLRILHITDPHVERWGALEDSVLAQAKALRPDLILMTGDYTGQPCKPKDARRLIAGLAEVAPTLCCRGNGDYRPPAMKTLFDGTGAVLLCNETREVSISGIRVLVTGVEPGHEDKVLSAPDPVPAAYSVCLYHYPDLVPRIAELPFDLMLCGHTHGGQVRLPLIGAVTSLSRVGPRCSRGLFSGGGKHAFVSQGVGCESYGLMALRFLCPPEVTLITVRKTL